MSSRLYQQAGTEGAEGAEGAGEPEASSGAADGETVDAEFEENGKA